MIPFTTRVLGLLTGLILLCAPATAAEPIKAKAAFEKLKTLAGEWKNSGGKHHAHGSKVIYKVTGNGSVVMETDFPGGDHEMVSMYHLDGEDLLLTHYCAAGNQPRMKLDREKSTADTLVFVFDGGTNLDPAKDMHIHAARFKFKAGDKAFESEWDAYMNGKLMHTETFRMSRE